VEPTTTPSTRITRINIDTPTTPSTRSKTQSAKTGDPKPGSNKPKTPSKCPLQEIHEVPNNPHFDDASEKTRQQLPSQPRNHLFLPYPKNDSLVIEVVPDEVKALIVEKEKGIGI
jgi:hypothetical protein